MTKLYNAISKLIRKEIDIRRESFRYARNCRVGVATIGIVSSAIVVLNNQGNFISILTDTYFYSAAVLIGMPYSHLSEKMNKLDNSIRKLESFDNNVEYFNGTSNEIGLRNTYEEVKCFIRDEKD